MKRLLTRLGLIMILSIFSALQMTAQERVVVSGVVYTKEGKPLSGADIKESGSANYTVSDSEGKFTLKVSGPKSLIEISYIGYESVSQKADRDFSHITLYNYVKRSDGHLTLSFSDLALKNSESKYPELKSNYGGGISIGKTFFFGNKKDKRTLRFGIAADFINANYSNYEIDLIDYQGTTSHTLDKIDAGIQVGPAFEINPVGKLKFQLYGKYSPNYSLLKIDTGDFGDNSCFSNGYAAGANIVIGKIGAGIEFRSISSEFTTEDEIDDPFLKDIAIFNSKTTSEGIRAYLIIKF